MDSNLLNRLISTTTTTSTADKRSASYLCPYCKEDVILDGAYHTYKWFYLEWLYTIVDMSLIDGGALVIPTGPSH
ncbi:MAG: hypothetical protein ACRD8Z_08770 [Nitrososphaeraceae archaeon]